MNDDLINDFIMIRNSIFFGFAISMIMVGGCRDRPLKWEKSKNTLDTSLITQKISLINNELHKKNMQSISDSMRFYIFNVFYDKEMSNLHDSINYLSYYDIEPIYLDVYDTLIVIRYNLLMRNDANPNGFTESTQYVFDVSYNIKNRSSIFDKSKFNIINQEYPYKRITVDCDTSRTYFLNMHKSRISKWYYKELKRRNCSFN